MAGQASCRRTHKTIADFRKDDGPAIKKVCAQFVELCRKMGLLAKASVKGWLMPGLLLRN